MNNSKCLLTLAALLIGAGCQSNHTRASNTLHGTLPNSQATYTIEIIPNPRLSATSREGDKSSEVYSSNIVAVYVHNPGGSNAAGTNANLIEARSAKK